MQAASDLDSKLARLASGLRCLESALVAFSGGVDSSFLLAAAVDVLGDRCVALTTVSPSTPAHDREAARDIARLLGVRHLLIDTNELDDPAYAANPINRCYFCKANLFTICDRERARLALGATLDGANVDDLGDHRPGLDAATRHGVRHPLIEAGLTKADIREASRRRGLPTWDRPASPCLASRIPYGTAITAERMARIDAAETTIRSFGIADVRVRAHDRLARIEIPLASMDLILAPKTRAAIVARLRDLGFTFVTIDLAGFRSGSLNEGIVPQTHAPQTHDGPDHAARARS